MSWFEILKVDDWRESYYGITGVPKAPNTTDIGEFEDKFESFSAPLTTFHEWLINTYGQEKGDELSDDISMQNLGTKIQEQIDDGNTYLEAKEKLLDAMAKDTNNEQNLIVQIGEYISNIQDNDNNKEEVQRQEVKINEAKARLEQKHKELNDLDEHIKHQRGLLQELISMQSTL